LLSLSDFPIHLQIAGDQQSAAIKTDLVARNGEQLNGTHASLDCNQSMSETMEQEVTERVAILGNNINS
jgi:hypothetical protein